MVFSPEYEYDKLVLPEGAEQLATGSVRVNWAVNSADPNTLNKLSVCRLRGE